MRLSEFERGRFNSNGIGMQGPLAGRHHPHREQIERVQLNLDDAIGGIDGDAGRKRAGK